jgi:hypothetical protein
MSESPTAMYRRTIELQPLDPAQVFEADAYWFGQAQLHLRQEKEALAHKDAENYWLGLGTPKEVVKARVASPLPEVLLGGGALVVTGTMGDRLGDSEE